MALVAFITEVRLLEDVFVAREKRKIIGNAFLDVWDIAIKNLNLNPKKWLLAQGTIYPDVIESISVKGPSATIKSHHNVGGLPESLHLE